MTTNNHPAHGPVSLDRLHQISEILSKAAAQSDGGNLGYAMADAVKVIDGAIAAFGAEPAPVDIEMLATVLRNAPLAPSDSQGKPRAPVVPDEDPRDAFERTFKMPKHVTRCGTGYAVTAYSAWLAHDFVRMWEGWNACRAAMLQGAEPASNCDELPLDYLQGHKDGLEWAAQLAKANHPETGDWLYDDPIELSKAIRKGPDMPLSDGNSPVTLDCWCHTCRPVTMSDMRFVVCPDCGNKRCPHANDHRNACTGSNEPGQQGSAYPAVPNRR
ncbi:hypothetical protein ACY3W2_003051 [Citrobacter freundii]